MIQSLINKHFFNLLLFTLTFGILLYDAIGFDYTDEICALFLFVLFGIYLFSTSDWNFNKGFLTTIGIFLFYFCYSLYIGSNTKTAIISDMLIQIKPYLAFSAYIQWCLDLANPKKHYEINMSCILVSLASDGTRESRRA